MSGGSRSFREEPEDHLKRVQANADRLQNRMTGADRAPREESRIIPAQKPRTRRPMSARDAARKYEAQQEFGMIDASKTDDGPGFG